MITNKSIGYTGLLGNQLFQYSLLFSIGLKHNYKIGLPLRNLNTKFDGCFNHTDNTWISFKLNLYDCFNIRATLLDDAECDKIIYNYKEPNFHFDSKVLEVSDNTNIEGYFQSYKYFDEFKSELLKELKFKNDIENKANSLINSMNEREIVSIHIRRNDYVKNGTLNLLDLNYFSAAADTFLDGDYNFLILSDDIEWCKETIGISSNVFFSEHNSNFVDMCLMSKCNHNIISNSSFSWWGAWLNLNENKKVIAPSKWFKDTNIITKDLIPETWIII
jgi:hypothetical protein